MFDYRLKPGETREKNIFEYNKNIGPQISIITAYYNGDEYIDNTINSVLNQTFPYWEWIIVNDGSTKKESLEKLEEIKKLDSRIKVVSKENSGLAATRDFGAKLSSKTSKFLIFLDDDDLINKTYLECAYWTLLTNTEASWAYTDVVNFQSQEFKWIKYFDSEVEKKENLLVATALIRKDDFFEVGGYGLKEKAVNEDWNLWLKLLAKNKKPVRMNFDGFWYRRKAQGSELQRSKENKKRALEIINETSKNIKERVEAIQYPKQDYNWEPIIERLENSKYKIKNDKINILMIIPWMVTGGADKFNLELISRINKEKYNVIIITTEPGVNNWRQKFEKNAIVYDLTTFLDKKYWLAFVSNIIEQYEIDLIFNTNSIVGYSMIPYLKAKYNDIPIIDYVHMEEWYNRCGGYSRDSSFVSSCIDRTLVCNQNSEKILVDYFKKNPSEVKTVYIGVDEEKYNPENINKDEAFEQFNINKKLNKYIISSICRVDAQKRPMLIIEIIKKLKEKRNDFVFVLAGNGTMMKMIKEKIKKYDLTNDIMLLGNVNDTEKVYKISDVTLNCSIKEGLALTSYESLAMGVPVVSSNVGGQAELINEEVGAVVPCMQNENEINNYNYKTEEIQNYVEALDKVLNNLDEYKNNCRKRVLNGFTINQMISNMEKEFEDVIKNKNQIKIQAGQALANVTDICKELITKSFVVMNENYRWLCEQVNISYFSEKTNNEYCGVYNYFDTPRGKLRLLIIRITKKIHLYEIIKKILKKIRKLLKGEENV